ncbi:uncharacterized protein [Apostichopus japonicus]|uniref:uncharacterized protein isoform X1 n=2 Tax=Stichopus japonicus TaxID=307972 RepID=UPI003AB1536B
MDLPVVSLHVSDRRGGHDPNNYHQLPPIVEMKSCHQDIHVLFLQGAHVIKTTPSVVHNEYSLRPHESIWYQVALSLLKSDSVEAKSFHKLATRLYKRFKKLSHFQTLYQCAKQAALPTKDGPNVGDQSSPSRATLDLSYDDVSGSVFQSSPKDEQPSPNPPMRRVVVETVYDTEDHCSARPIPDVIGDNGPDFRNPPTSEMYKVVQDDACDRECQPDLPIKYMSDDNDNDEEQESSPYTPPNEIFCICLQPNDGSPYLKCDMCRQWYHFDCVGFSTSPDTPKRVEDSPFLCGKCQPSVRRGIVNIGNTCWFSAMIQAVNATHIGKILKRRPTTLDNVDEEIKRLLTALEEDTALPIDEIRVRNVVSAISGVLCGSFQDITRQQDASEFYTACISPGLEKQQILGGVPPITSTAVTEIVTCLKCGHEERRQNTITLLTVVPNGCDTIDNINALFEDSL